jgi:hypothetical protein
VTWSALLFAVYPAFFQQPVAVAYSQHFITYIFFLLSLGFMVMFVRKSSFRWGWMSLSIICQLIHILTMEYFWGLELIRPVILWIATADRVVDIRKRFIYTFKLWLPNLLIFMVGVYWRMFVYQPPIEDPNKLEWLDLLRQSPPAAFLRLFEIILRDLVNIIVSTWYRVLRVDTITFDTIFSTGVWIIVFLTVLSVFGFIHFIGAGVSNRSSTSQSRKQYIFLGLWSILCGFIPICLTNKESLVGMYSDRFTLAGIFGASIMLVGLIDYLLADNLKKDIIISLLVGLAVGAQIRVANTYRWDWIYQQRFYWQFHWRIPALEPDTAIFSEGTIFGFVGDFPTAYALNVLQSDKRFSKDPLYWFFELDKKFAYFPDRYLKGRKIEYSIRNVYFEGYSLDSIVIDYDSKSSNCVWVADQGDYLVFSLPDLTRAALPMSDLERIDTSDAALAYPIPAEIFGAEPERYWCYYFQKASLARQNEDWEKILSLMADVKKAGYDPNNSFEWLPFIDAHLQLGKWEAARELILDAYADEPATAAAFCEGWLQASRTAAEPPSEDVFDSVSEQLSCLSP